MRWVVPVTLAMIALLGTKAEARRRGPTAAKHIVKKSAAPIVRKPKVVAIAKAMTAMPTAVGSAPAEDATKPPEKPAATDDPILAGADRVVGRDRDGFVAFTFDDGPNPPTTPVVLDALQKYDIPATFFIVTRHLGKAHPQHEEAKQLLEKEIQLGYLIGNHTAHHANLQKADDKKLDAEMDGAFTTLFDETKKPLGLFRAPYGRMNAKARARLHKLGATEVYWSIDSRDWETAEKDAQRLRKRVMKSIITQNGGVVLMHDTRKVTAAVINEVFDDLEIENCRRLAANEQPIWPVTLHYFLRDGGTPRAIPDEVQKQTTAYKKALPDRCAQRAAAK